MSKLPFYSLLSGFYSHGANAVGFFFVLSGFVFYWLYSTNIHKRNIGLTNFCILRLSRLYPLQLFTLLLCVALQWLAKPRLGADFVYQHDDLAHFVMNLFLVQFWGFQSGYSWNGPSWSISVEIALYGLFFIGCLLLRPNLIQCFVFLLAAWSCAHLNLIGSAGIAFFSGGACYWIFRSLAPRWKAKYQALLLTFVVAAWCVIPHTAQESFVTQTVSNIYGFMGDNRLGHWFATFVKLLMQRQNELLLFPITVLALALTERTWHALPWRRLHEFGNLSFGIYLFHFPLQIAFVYLALKCGAKRDFFVEHSTFVMFFCCLISISLVSYHFFERPMMTWMRQRTMARNET